MHNAFALIAGSIAVVAAIPYIKKAIRGKTRPNVVTWFTWTDHGHGTYAIESTFPNEAAH